ncbi:MAG: hypothetical protein ABJ360_02275 [Roseobacter sp.]
MAGVRALDDAFQTALVAKGYKKNVIKIEKGTQKGQESTRFVKGDSMYVFIHPSFYKGSMDFDPFVVGFSPTSPNPRWWWGQ